MEAAGHFKEAERPVEFYPHSMFTVGVGTQFDGQDIVIVHVTMGERRFQFRFTPENARRTADAMYSRADHVQYGVPIPYEPNIPEGESDGR